MHARTRTGRQIQTRIYTLNTRLFSFFNSACVGARSRVQQDAGQKQRRQCIPIQSEGRLHMSLYMSVWVRARVWTRRCLTDS